MRLVGTGRRNNLRTCPSFYAGAGVPPSTWCSTDHPYTVPSLSSPQARGRPAIWWQTQKTAQAANPGARIPRGRSAGVLTIAIDTREKYGWKFADRELVIERRALPAGDYAAIMGGAVVAAIERKTLENLATSLSDGSLAFQLQRLAELPRAAIVVEGDYPDLFRTQPGRGSWLADMLGRLAVRYPEVPVVFAGSRKFAEEWAYRFLGAAVADHTESS